MNFWREVWKGYKKGIVSKIFWPFWAWMVFAFAFLLTTAFVGCDGRPGTPPSDTTAPVEEPEPPIEEPAIEEPVVADVPVDRAGRPMVDEEGNEIPIEERELPEEE